MNNEQMKTIPTKTSADFYNQEYVEQELIAEGSVGLKYDNGALLEVAESVEPNDTQLQTIGQIIDGLPTNSYGACSGKVEILEQKEDGSLVVSANIDMFYSMPDGGEVQEGYTLTCLVDVEGNRVGESSQYTF